MNDRKMSPCEGLIDYLTGESFGRERKRFEKHMATCSSCQEEAIVWQEVWDRLKEDAEMLELPADLKEEVLGSLFAQEKQPSAPLGKSRSSWFNRRYARGGVAVALLLIVFISGWLIRDWQIQGSDQAASVEEPASIEWLLHLSAEKSNGRFNDSPRAYGIACLVRSPNGEQLVVYVFGSPRTKDDEVYRVWLWKDGQRTSAGAFTVDDSGIGVMTLPLSNGIPDIDSIGVTLEPDSQSASPRGPKMFGSMQPDDSVNA
ncbi:anti-sigma factor domain-containing protein [Cohnella sp.]|uniref:anti-sigma factor n=1 Tax=Cohnella sp. TaxID=1883426 RepID=UPI003563025B